MGPRHSTNTMNMNQIDQLSCTYTLDKQFRKINLFLIVRILLHILSKENRRLRYVAQQVLKDSYKIHQKCPESQSLASLIENGLLEIDGIEKYWKKAMLMQRQKGCSVSVKSISRRNNESIFTVNVLPGRL